MGVIDLDRELLRASNAAAQHAHQQGAIHFEQEYKGFSQELVDTLSPTGPYGYTITPEVLPDGGVRLPILTTREEIADAYRMVRGWSDLHAVDPIAEIRGSWYVFVDSISRATVRSTGQHGNTRLLGLLPTGNGGGITGELFWMQVPPSRLGGEETATQREPKADMFLREDVFLQHQQYMEALRLGDTDGIVATFHPRVASAVRDYVHDTGTLIGLDGIDAHRDYYDALFTRYQVDSVDPLHRIAEHWYVFAELRVTVTSRDDGVTSAFHTAEFWAPANDGRFIARIGHGTNAG